MPRRPWIASASVDLEEAGYHGAVHTDYLIKQIADTLTWCCTGCTRLASGRSKIATSFRLQPSRI